MKKRIIWLIAIALFVAACGSDDAAEDVAEPAADQPRVAAAPVDTPTPILTEADIIEPVPSGVNLQPNLAAAGIDMDDVVALLPPDAIPAISPDMVAEIMVSAQEANDGGMEPNVRVIGVSVNGESHAYPLPYLSRHEIVNVDLGGEKLAVTW